MDGFKEENPSPNGSLLPPVVTRRKSFRSSAPEQPTSIAPPYIAGSRAGSIQSGPVEPPAPEQATAKEEIADDMAWDSMSDEGVVESAFKADTEAVLEQLSSEAADGKREEFPLEAFIVPEQSDRVPNGMEGKPLPPVPENTPITYLAERLEKLSHRLRIDDTDTIVRRLAAGDRLDTLLAGLLAGYLAGSSDHS